MNKKKVLLSCIIVLFCSASSFAATKTWRHDPFSDYRWKTDANWDLGSAPTANDDVIFDSSDTTVCTIEGAAAVARSVSIRASYTGTVEQKASLTVSATFEQLGGTFKCVNPSSYPLSVGNSFFVTREALFLRYTGSGTSVDPYMVYDVYGLQAMGSIVHLSKCFKLANDIDASSTASWNWNPSRASFEGFVPIGYSNTVLYYGLTAPFVGSFEGNYKVINSLYMNRYAENYIGLFGVISSGAVISNVRLTNTSIWSSSNVCSGMLTGFNYLGTIQKCGVSGTITFYAGPLSVSAYMGGLVGENYGTINTSYSEGETRYLSTSYPLSINYSGGLVGYNQSSGYIGNSYSSLQPCSTNGWDGGLAGYNRGQIINCYSGGRYSNGIYGLVEGQSYGSGYVSNSYFLNSNNNNYAGTAVSLAQMSKEATFSGWDFGRIWTIDENKSMPYLLWQTYSWLGEDSEWTTPSTWNFNSGYPSLESHKAYINSGSVGLNSPTFETTIGGMKIGPDFATRLALGANMTITSSANKSGNLIIMNGSFEGRGKTLNIYGDLRVSPEARFYPNTPALTNSGTLEFFGSGQVSNIVGNIRSYNVKCAVPYKRITFESGSVNTIEGSLYLSGEAGKEILLKGSVPGAQWYIHPKGLRTANYLIVSDSYNLSSESISTLNSYDGGNNFGWVFSAGSSVSVFQTGEGGTVNPDGTFGEVTIPTAESRTFTISASSGYYIGYVRIDGTFETGVSSADAGAHYVTILGSSGHHSIEAYFVKNGIKVWDGGGSDSNFSTNGNWTGDSVPSPSDSMMFSSVSTKAAIINTSFTVVNITIEAGYNAKITQQGALTLTGSFEQYGGSFECTAPQSYSLSIAGNFRIPDNTSSFMRFSGAGISGNPYIIYDIYGLQAVRCNPDKYFKLNNNIDASITRRWNWKSAYSTHEGFNPIGISVYYSALPNNPFTGYFDGNSNKISNLWIQRNNDRTQSAFGLFGLIKGATIKRLSLVDLYVRANGSTGGLFGSAYDPGCLISECSVSGVVHGNGGFSGSTWSSSGTVIEKCYANVLVYGYGTMVADVGATYNNNYSEGLVINNWHSGGFASYASSSQFFRNCYTTATVETTSIDNVGGFVGFANSSSISSCYYTDYKYYFNNLATKVTQDQLKVKSTFSGWDFDNVWSIDEGYTNPYLLWSVYNWRGGNAGGWANPDNWNKELEKASDYPRTISDKVFLNATNESISTPAAAIVLGELRLGSSYEATLTLGGDLLLTDEAHKGGSLIIFGGTLEAGSKSISLECDFIRGGSGSFSYGTGTVEMLGRNKLSLLKGSKSVYNLLCRTSGKTISFESGSIHTIEGSWSFSGEAGSANLIKLTGSRSSPEVWYVNSKGSRNLKNLIVSNSYNISSTLITPENSYDGGNNYRWSGFIGYSVRTSTNQGGTISPEGDSVVNSGSYLEVTVTSSEGYYIGFIKIDGIPTTESLLSPKKIYIAGDKFHSVEAYFAQAGVKVWSGNGNSNYWSDPVNWTGNATPEVGERVVFNSTSSKLSRIDTFGTGVIRGLSIESASSVSLTQEAPLRITGTYEQTSLTALYSCPMPATCPLTIEGGFIIPDIGTTGRFQRYETSGSDRIVYDIYGLQGMIGYLSSNIVLGSDIDAYPTKNWNWDGTRNKGFIPLGNATNMFSGTIDGNGYYIRGLWINRPAQNYVGLTGYSWNNSFIEDLGLSDCYIVGKLYVGGMSGYMGISHADNLNVQGFISGESTVGGIFGYTSWNQIQNSYFSGRLISLSYYAGGIVGYAGSGIVDCYSDASIEGVNTVGGIAGITHYVDFKDNYFSGSVRGLENVGSLIGRRDYAGIENSFFIDAAHNNNLGTLITTSELKSRNFLKSAGWDFGTVWSIDDSRGFPYLQREKWLWIGSTGGGDGSSWTDPLNWNKRNGYPTNNGHKVFINTAEADITTPGAEWQLAGLQLGTNFDKKISLGNNLVLDSSAGYEGSLYIYGGTFEAGSRTITVDGNFYKSSAGSFDKGTSTVAFEDASYPSFVEGSTIFRNLSCSAPGKMISFEAGTRQTVEGSFYMSIGGGNKIALRSSVPGSTWEIDPIGTRTVNYVTVKDSKNISIEDITAGNSVDYGNNIGWVFTNYAVQVIARGHGLVNTQEGTFYVDTPEGGALTFFVSSESPSYYISDVKIDGISTAEVLFPGSRDFTISNIAGFHTLEALFREVGDKLWDGGGSTYNWSDPLNWSGNTTPSATDITHFNNASTKISSIDANFMGIIKGISIESGYTGTIRQNKSLSVTGSFEQVSGYFVCTNPTVCSFSVAGRFSITTADASFIRYTGSGTSTTSAYVIYDIYGLQAMKCNLNKHFSLYYDISGAVTSGWNWNDSLSTYEGFSPIGGSGYPFAGSLNGKTFTISNLSINRATRDYIGLFGAVGTGANIYNLGLTDSYIKANGYAGSLVGYNNGGTVSKCLSKRNVLTFGAGNYLGGFAGYNTSTIENSYSGNYIYSSDSNVGGFVGYNSGSISKCYSFGSSYMNYADGFVDSGTNVSGCYYSTYESGKTGSNLGALGLSPVQMKQAASFTDWDFDNIWTIDEGHSYPYLVMELYNWVGEAPTPFWTNTLNWNKKTSYPSSVNDKVYINMGSQTILTPTGDMYLGALIFGPEFSGFVSLNGDLYLGNSSTREGSLLLLGGTLAANNRNIFIDGRFKRSGGQFAEDDRHTVIFTGSGASLIEGSTDFYNLYCTKEGKSLTFAAGSVQTIEGTLRLSSEGGAASKIILRSASTGSQWYINPSGTLEPVYFVDVKDSVNLRPQIIDPFYSRSSGNNVNWFTPYYITSEVTKVGSPDARTWGTIEPFGLTTVYHGDSQVFNIIPISGFKISNVRFDGLLQGATSEYTVSLILSNHTIEAMFEIRPFILTAEVTGNGSGSITPSGTIEAQHYSSKLFTVEANAGSYTAFVRIDGRVTTEGLTNPSVYPSIYHVTFESVEWDHTIEARILDNSYRIWSGNGTTDNWSDAYNWTGGVTPDASSHVIFNSTSTKNSSIDASFVGSIKSISIESGYTGTVTIGRTFTVEGNVSIESGTLYQSGYDMYISGDFYSTFETGSSPGFYAQSGTVFFNGTLEVQHIKTFGSLFGGLPDMFYNFKHTGSAELKISSEAAFYVMNDFLNSSGAGTCEVYHTFMVVGGGFTNESNFNFIPDWTLPQDGGFFGPFSILNIMILVGPVINTSGTGEGKDLSAVLLVGSDVTVLEAPLKTIAILLMADTFDANGHDIYFSSMFSGGTNFVPNGGVLNIIETDPNTSANWTSACWLTAGSLFGLQCKVPGKTIYFERAGIYNNICTIEEQGFVTFEGGLNVPDYISLVPTGEGTSRWLFDPRCTAEGHRTFYGLNVADSHNISGTDIETTNSLGNDNNIGWVFSRYNFTATGNNGGTIEPAGTIYPEKDSAVTYEVRANSGYYIGYVLRDGIPVTSEGNYSSPYYVTFEAITRNHTIEAYFDKVGGRTWTGNGSTNNWSEAANWSGNLVPLSTEEVVFSSVGTKDSTIDSSFGGTIGGISIESRYTGAITQARHLTVSATFEQYGGRFISPAPTYGFTVEGSFKIPDTAQAFTRFGGSGTEGSPYIIYDIYGLQGMKSYKSAYFELNNDISAEATYRWNPTNEVYQGFDPVGNTSGNFTGSLDGKGFVISGLRIKRTQNNVGLFGVVGSGASITAIGMRSSSVEGASNVGLLAGVNSGIVSRAYTKGAVIGTGSNIGGMVGNNMAYVGNSYSTANVYGGSVVGGLIGHNETVVTEGYATGSVSGTNAGGFAGANAGAINNSHFTDSAHNNGLGSLETAAQIKQKNRFSNWDFDRVWTIDEAKASPQLMWEIYTWTGSADGTSWTNPNNWNKKSGYPSTKEHKAFINSGVSFSTPVGSQLDLGGLQIGPDYAGTLTMGGTLNLDNSGTREGSLILLGGALATNNQNIYISGNFKRAAGGTYTTSTGDTIFTSEAASLIEGSTTFTDVICNVPGKRLTFEAGTIQTIEGTLAISGEAGRWISFESSMAGAKFKINPSGTNNIYFVSVKDSTNESANVLDPGGSNLNLGNTSRWFTYYIYATKEAHGIITPEGIRVVTITTIEPTTYTITTEAGYYVFDVEVDNISQGVLTSYSFSDIRGSHTIEVLVTTEARITEEPRGLRVNVSGSNVVLNWNSVAMATQYRIYRSASRTAAIMSGWTLVGSVDSPSLTWSDIGAVDSTTEAYYIVRAFNSGGESGNSSMGVYKKVSFTRNASGTANVNRISIPYNSAYRKASSVVQSIEGSSSTANKIQTVGLWNPSSQNSTQYFYDSEGGLWDGTDFDINPGTGIYVVLSGSATTFGWSVTGTDTNTPITFESNPSGTANLNYISIPYTGMYLKASNIVSSIEAQYGVGKIQLVGLWEAGTQNTTQWFYEEGVWDGTDFDITIGKGLVIGVVPGASRFDWIPGLLVPPRE